MVSFKLRFLYQGERSPGTHWIEGWVGPGSDLDAVEIIEISLLCRGSNPGPLPIARRYTDSAIIVEGRIILERNLKKQIMGMWAGSSWFKIVLVTGSTEHGKVTLNTV
jgi:hypothetical protein